MIDFFELKGYRAYQNVVCSIFFQSSALKHCCRSADNRSQFLNKTIIAIGDLLDFGQLLFQDAPPGVMDPASSEIAPEKALYPLAARSLQTMTLCGIRYMSRISY